jgi:hypothetical protein
MLQTLSQLGRIEDNQESNSNIENVIGMNFKYNTDGVLEYDKSETHELGDISRYLYEPVKSGKPGLFLTGHGDQEFRKISRPYCIYTKEDFMVSKWEAGKQAKETR